MRKYRFLLALLFLCLSCGSLHAEDGITGNGIWYKWSLDGIWKCATSDLTVTSVGIPNLRVDNILVQGAVWYKGAHQFNDFGRQTYAKIAFSYNLYGDNGITLVASGMVFDNKTAYGYTYDSNGTYTESNGTIPATLKIVRITKFKPGDRDGDGIPDDQDSDPDDPDTPGGSDGDDDDDDDGSGDDDDDDDDKSGWLTWEKKFSATDFLLTFVDKLTTESVIDDNTIRIDIPHYTFDIEGITTNPEIGGYRIYLEKQMPPYITSWPLTTFSWHLLGDDVGSSIPLWKKVRDYLYTAWKIVFFLYFAVAVYHKYCDL